MYTFKGLKPLSLLPSESLRKESCDFVRLLLVTFLGSASKQQCGLGAIRAAVVSTRLTPLLADEAWPSMELLCQAK